MLRGIERIWITRAGLEAVVRIVCHTRLPEAGSYWWRCGYVGVPPGHPLHGITEGDVVPQFAAHFHRVLEGPIGKRGIITMLTARPDRPTLAIMIDVHGSLTYSGSGRCGYPRDEMDDLWWFGFDCNHDGDSAHDDERRIGVDDVVDECESLAQQIVDLVGSMGDDHATRRD